MATIKVKGTITTDTQASFYRWFGIDAFSPSMLEDGLNEAAGEDVELEIASPGGTVVAGYEIYALLKKYEGRVTAHITWACSAATLIACACDEVLISEAGVYMIHNTQGSAEGDYRAMNEESQALRALNDGIINAYEKKTGLTREKLQSLMDKSTYMSPQKAIELGFVDGYMTGKEEKQFDITSAAAGLTPQIPEENVASLMAVKKFIEEVGGEENALAMISQKTELSVFEDKAASKKGAEAMTLEEFLNENPDAQAELDSRLATAKAEGVSEERDRMKSLDDIANSIPSEMLAKAKYEEPTNGKDLAYKALVEGKQIAQAYMSEAIKDSVESGVNEVGVGSIEAGENNTEKQEQEEAANTIAEAFRNQ